MAPLADSQVCQEINPQACMARVWGGGLGGQCKRGRARDGGEFCTRHAQYDQWKVHGRVDGPIPAGKLQAFAKSANANRANQQTVQPSLKQEAPSLKRKRTIESEGAIEAYFNQWSILGGQEQRVEQVAQSRGRGKPPKYLKRYPESGAPLQRPGKASSAPPQPFKPLLEDPNQDPEISRLERAAHSFRPGRPAGGLPCRDAEKEKIFTHLSSAVRQGGTSQVLYISGMPGTGKTACVLEVIEDVRKVTPQFELVHVNAMCLASPAAVFAEIHAKMPCAPVNAQETRNDLQRFFLERQQTDPVILLLVDEVDLLVTPSQAVLYRLFDWLALPRARLVFVAISNTINLPERLLPRVASRFDIVRLDFEAYSKAQIYEILSKRLEAHDAKGCFNETVLRLCSARVAAGSGDIRKALQVCRRAVESRLTDSKADGPVNMPHLEAAEKDLLHANPVVQTIAGLSAKARRFLAAFAMELRKQESDTVQLARVTSQYKKLLIMASMESMRCDFDEGDHPAAGCTEDAQFLAKRLEAMSLLIRQTERGCRKSVGNVSISVFNLGAGLDIEDLVGALLKSEEDESIRELLDLGRSSQAVEAHADAM